MYNKVQVLLYYNNQHQCLLFYCVNAYKIINNVFVSKILILIKIICIDVCDLANYVYLLSII